MNKAKVYQNIYLDNLAIYKNVQHDIGDWVVIASPTCTRDGIKNKYCQICNRVMETETQTALGHVYGEWVTVLDTSFDICDDVYAWWVTFVIKED